MTDVDTLLAALDSGRKDDIPGEHGRPTSYQHGCKCRLCRRAHADRMRAYRASVKAKVAA